MAITPDTHPGNFTAEEAALFRKGKCCYVTSYGGPGIRHCGKKSKRGADYGYCADHAQKA